MITTRDFPRLAASTINPTFRMGNLPHGVLPICVGRIYRGNLRHNVTEVAEYGFTSGM